MPRGLNGSFQFMPWLIPNSGKDVGYLRAPDFRIVNSTSRLPKNAALMGVID
jgi:hypothetical protein